MNLFNRLLATLVALASVAVGILILLTLAKTVAPAALPLPVLRQQLAGIAGHTGAALWQDVGIAAALIIVGLLVLALEARSLTRRTARGMTLVSSEPAGIVRMSIDSISQLAQRTAQANREVRSIRCQVRAGRSGLTISCMASLRMGADVPAVSSDVQRNIREVVERLTGLSVIDVPVRVRYEGSRNQPVLAR